MEKPKYETAIDKYMTRFQELGKHDPDYAAELMFELHDEYQRYLDDEYWLLMGNAYELNNKDDILPSVMMMTTVNYIKTRIGLEKDV